MQDNTRRIIGGVTGMLVGFSYALLSNTINSLVLPGVPLYAPPPGVTLTILMTSVLFFVFGLIVTWSEEALSGLIISALVGSILSSAWVWFSEAPRPAVLVLLFLVFLPRAFFYLPIGIAIVWVVNRWERSLEMTSGHFYYRVAPLLLCLIASAVMASFSLHSKEIRLALKETNQLVIQGMQAQSKDELPEPLKDVYQFVGNAKGKYMLRVSLNPDLLPAQRPVAAYGVTESLIIVLFDNGYMFGCVFTPPSPNPVCSTFQFR